MYLEKKICLYFQKGYCKFGVKCKLEHINDICEKKNCDIERCFLRHPTKCKFFAINGNCKFGNYCAYLHSPSEDKEKIKDLEKVVLETKCKVEKLDEEIISLKNLINALSNFNDTIETLWSNSSLEEAEVDVTIERCEPHPVLSIVNKNVNDDGSIISISSHLEEYASSSSQLEDATCKLFLVHEDGVIESECGSIFRTNDQLQEHIKAGNCWG